MADDWFALLTVLACKHNAKYSSLKLYEIVDRYTLCCSEEASIVILVLMLILSSCSAISLCVHCTGLL